MSESSGGRPTKRTMAVPWSSDDSSFQMQREIMAGLSKTLGITSALKGMRLGMNFFHFRSLVFFAALVSVLLASCVSEITDAPAGPSSERIPISLSGEISQVYQTRVSDGGFADGDRIGVYVVDFENESPGTLKNAGNRADNVWHQYSAAERLWVAGRDIYWKDRNTHADIYAYYPYTYVENPASLALTVSRDQRVTSDGTMSGYEASDFLWGKSADVAPTGRTVNVEMTHRMASVVVSLEEGGGFGSGEWDTAVKEVMLTGLRTGAVVNLADGVVSVSAESQEAGGSIIPYENGGVWRAVTVPQKVASGTALISITVGGRTLKFSVKEDVELAASRQHNFTIVVNRKEDGDFDLVLGNFAVSDWENDSASHDWTAAEYIVVNVAQAGTLEETLAATTEIDRVRNLKITGQINGRDFAVMRHLLTSLSALNLKEVRIVACDRGQLDSGEEYDGNEDDVIPAYALNSKKTLTSIIFPDRLRGINESAFTDCNALAGSLTFPEGLEFIDKAAFRSCSSLSGSLNLPSTLKRIGNYDGYLGYWDGAFAGCYFACELKLPDGLVEIGKGTFLSCSCLYGELHLPENLEYIGEDSFANCGNLRGTLVIPKGVKVLPVRCFSNTGFDGNLVLNDGLSSIEGRAFENTPFRGELVLPESLTSLGEHCFNGCDFSGKLVLPAALRAVGNWIFAHNTRLSGVLEIPENVISIGVGAFSGCRGLEGLVLPSGMESILADRNDSEGGAFQNCFGLNSIVCKCDIPPTVQQQAFEGVPKDNFTVEVPESAVIQYRVATGWKDFKRVSAYRRLSARPSAASALNTSVTRKITIDADEDWVVAEKPDWVALDRTSGDGKAELSLTFQQMPSGETREGKVVFKLAGKDYSVSVDVRQYDFEYAEDEAITIQSATEGSGVNVVFLGDGYSAEDISKGLLMEDIGEAVEHFFGIEPFRTYRSRFNVYTAAAVSPESGVGSVNTIIYNRFNTSAKGGATLGGRFGDSDYAEIFSYACRMPTVSEENLSQTLVVMIPNTSEYGGTTYLYDDGSAIAYCPKSDYGYPQDFRGVVQHEACGHGFGKLGDEYIYHNAFIDACGCTCCGHAGEFNAAKSKGWFANLSLSGKPEDVPWKHLIYHEKYRGFVDVYEGGFMHSRGVWRSEYNSCMNNDMPYFSTISREEIVRRIMEYSGGTFSFDEFVAKDNLESAAQSQALGRMKSRSGAVGGSSGTGLHNAPVFCGKRPVAEGRVERFRD